MALSLQEFENIIATFVNLRLDRAKSRLREMHADIPFEQEPSFSHAFDLYWAAVSTVYARHFLVVPPVFMDDFRKDLGEPDVRTIDEWLVNRCIYVQLKPLDIQRLADQLNQDFGTHYRLPIQFAVPSHQTLHLEYLLKDTMNTAEFGIFANLRRDGHQEQCIASAGIDHHVVGSL